MSIKPARMTQEQYEFCKKQANILAKLIMELDVKNIFGNDGNANFVLETIVILTAGTLSVIAKQINLDPFIVLKAFYGHTIDTIEINKKKPFLKLVN